MANRYKHITKEYIKEKLFFNTEEIEKLALMLKEVEKEKKSLIKIEEEKRNDGKYKIG